MTSVESQRRDCTVRPNRRRACLRAWHVEPLIGLIARRDPRIGLSVNIPGSYGGSVQGIPLARLSHVLRDLFGLEISEGALVNILSASRKPFAAQTSLIKARLMAGTALASDETGMRVSKANWWLWVLTANPKPRSIAAVWGAYDLLVSGAVEAIRRAGRNEIKSASIDGDRIGFQMLLEEDSPFISTVARRGALRARAAGSPWPWRG